MTQKKVGIIIIGNEILSGRTYDKNVNFIAKKLIKNGLELLEVRIIPDDQKKIIAKQGSVELWLLQFI